MISPYHNKPVDNVEPLVCGFVLYNAKKEGWSVLHCNVPPTIPPFLLIDVTNNAGDVTPKLWTIIRVEPSACELMCVLQLVIHEGHNTNPINNQARNHKHCQRVHHSPPMLSSTSNLLPSLRRCGTFHPPTCSLG